MIPVILEVAISLIVIFFLLSTVVSFINEIIALVLSSRGKTLKNSLKTLFDEMGQEGGFREELSSETNPLKKLAIIFTKIFGILLTTFCLTLGAPTGTS